MPNSQDQEQVDFDLLNEWEEVTRAGNEDRLAEWLTKVLKDDVRKALSEDGKIEEIADSVRATWQIQEQMGDYGSRAKAAATLIERLVPTEVDVKLWRDLALGRNIKLSEAAQYGDREPRTKKGAKRQNDFGDVHDKQDAPSQFIARQATAVLKEARNIVELEEQLKDAKSRKAALEEGARAFAATCLLTQMRKATTPLFAVGPAWTILRAISGSSGKEVQSGEQENDTQRIMVVLHALCEFEPFEQDLKSAILSVCLKHRQEAIHRRRMYSEFEGPYDYEMILEKLKFPESASQRL